MYFLDTNILIHLLRGKYNLDKKINEKGIENFFISEISVAELFYGAFCSQDVIYNLQNIRKFLEHFKILPLTDSLENFAKIKADLRYKGLMVEDFDIMIGATALTNNLILITENTKHFKNMTINYLNWVKR